MNRDIASSGYALCVAIRPFFIAICLKECYCKATILIKVSTLSKLIVVNSLADLDQCLMRHSFRSHQDLESSLHD